MATSELESHSVAKLTNSGEISNGYEYSQECLDQFLPKEAIIKC